MTEHLTPGPYITDEGDEVIVPFGAIEGGGIYVWCIGHDDHVYLYYRVDELTPAKEWHEWWPVELRGPLPERPIQVGDWVQRRDVADARSLLVIGNRFGRWQLVDGKGKADSWSSLGNFVRCDPPEEVEA